MRTIEQLDQVRKERGFSQSSVAQAMHVSPPVLSRALRGNPTQGFLERYQQALDDISRGTTPKHIAAIAKPIALRNRVDELYLFGSMARGEGRADSDIDFIYHFSPDANPLIDVIALRDELRRAFGRDIDLVRKDYLTQPQRDQLKEMQRILFVNSITKHPMYRIV
ncbi:MULTISPECIES: nucleotidyltransferase domain-containing protein [Bifidobacterium]|uniref:nucleotidyltransferase domain-containing protein n=1 Tax=Bifidobacterium TaxID=1678 RepID=UPI001BDD9D35|nr:MULTISPECIES: nucleotidyltransferase domain-containing protein [Bifidobacterium]MBT1160440.1 nucleotidyltransferase domain-containing protein [Bifidobacterium sp. SO1]MBW3079559.1 nucleotidyltransferase domain-containing protein [Bifidobacterium simiiventris]